MLTVNFLSKSKFAYPRRKFLKLVKSICKRFRVSCAIVNIVITNNRQICSLNKKFHHRNSITDCLSFDLSDEPGFSHFTTKKKLKKISAVSAACPELVEGFSAVRKSFDIIVNAQKAISEAKKRNHSSQAELALYITHALLHNLGFDDSTAKKAKLMHQMEDEILQQEGFGKVFNSHRAF